MKKELNKFTENLNNFSRPWQKMKYYHSTLFLVNTPFIPVYVAFSREVGANHSSCNNSDMANILVYMTEIIYSYF